MAQKSSLNLQAALPWNPGREDFIFLKHQQDTDEDDVAQKRETALRRIEWGL